MIDAPLRRRALALCRAIEHAESPLWGDDEDASPLAALLDEAGSLLHALAHARLGLPVPQPRADGLTVLDDAASALVEIARAETHNEYEALLCLATEPCDAWVAEARS